MRWKNFLEFILFNILIYIHFSSSAKAIPEVSRFDLKLVTENETFEDGGGSKKNESHRRKVYGNTLEKMKITRSGIENSRSKK